MPKKIELDENFIVEQSQKMSCAEMARLLGVSAVTITTRLKKYGITCCGSRKDIEGMKFGKLKVLEFSEDKAKNGTSLWNCICDCGQKCLSNAAKLLSGRKKSCGCISRTSGDLRPSWKGCGDISGEYWAGVRWNAKSRKLAFDLRIEDAWEMYLQQNRMCSLSGLEIGFFGKKATASLDRIDSNQGYIKGNTQWLHKDVNFMKQALEQERFLFLCKKITEN
jgi:hypothetical protein